MDNNNIIDVNENNFENLVIEQSYNKLVVVDFWAPWCGPCKQLTPILEKIISKTPEKTVLAKINIDENQQLASQLRIQSIPTVFAFKEKQVVNAFQGVISEKDIIAFLEQSLGEKLNINFDDFYKEIQSEINEKKFDIAREKLEDFLSKNSKEIKAIYLYAECLINMNNFSLAKEFIDSLDETILKNEEIKKILKRIELINKNNKGPTVNELKTELSNSPNNLELVFKIADLYFASNKFDECFQLLLQNYPKNKEEIKKKLFSFFDVLGFDNKFVIFYRKKLSSIIFS